MKAVIPAAGLGVRFLPATKAQPKEMLPVVDKPCIQYVVEEAVSAGITDIVIITGRGKRAIEDHFDRSIELEQRLIERNEKEIAEKIREISDLADIFYIRQSEPLGLGHAILCAKKHIGREPFAVLLGDDLVINDKPAILQLIERFEEMNEEPIVGIEGVPRESAFKYGIISGKEVGEKLYHIDDLVEKPEPGKEPSNLAIMGRYVLTPEIFDKLERMNKCMKVEMQLTDAMRELAKERKMYGLLVSGRRYDLGDKVDWIRANIELALERPDLHDSMRDLIKRASVNP
jgi:UTP--glucose-1-phosphate uridylyltransferase